jgi:hypothetical protein
MGTRAQASEIETFRRKVRVGGCVIAFGSPFGALSAYSTVRFLLLFFALFAFFAVSFLLFFSALSSYSAVNLTL